MEVATLKIALMEWASYPVGEHEIKIVPCWTSSQTLLILLGSMGKESVNGDGRQLDLPF